MKEQTRLSLELELWDNERRYVTIDELLLLAEYGYRSMLKEKSNIDLLNLHTETFNFGKD
jgi:hypothetical protein